MMSEVLSEIRERVGEKNLLTRVVVVGVVWT